jgi:transcriptional regulator with XRE-family HTH domain
MAGDVGERLREERLRLCLSQDEIAAVGGVTRRTQTAYESDGGGLNAGYLVAVRELGVDIFYVLTGERLPTHDADPGVTNDDEQEVLRKYRLLNEAGKGAVEALMNGFLMAGEFTRSGKPSKRAPRLAANRAAAMNAETADVVRRALGDQRERTDARPKKRS